MATATTDPRKLARSNTQTVYEISSKDMPASCPMPGTTLWNSHPHVFLAFDENGEAQCAYCGALYRLRADD